MKAWRRHQWAIGNRNCTYCLCRLSQASRSGCDHAPTDATVDHKHPITLGGDDAPWNYAMACRWCNNRKGSMMEDEFRALIAAEAAGIIVPSYPRLRNATGPFERALTG